MPPDLITAVGYVAGTLTTISFLPQLVKTWRCKSAKELSWIMLLAFAAGVSLWLAYGIFLRKAPIIVANAATLALVLLILALKVYYREHGKPES